MHIVLIGTRESEIFVRIELNHKSNRQLRFEFELNLESNQSVVVYMFNANATGVVYAYSQKLPYCMIAPIVLASVYALAT